MMVKIHLWFMRNDGIEMQRSFRLIGLIASFLLLSGCSPDQKKTSPSLDSSSKTIGSMERFRAEFGYLISPPESIVDEWYRDYQARNLALPAGKSPDESYPNLGTVPPRPPQVTSAERQKFIDSLNSNYQELWQTKGDKQTSPWGSYRSTVDLPSPPVAAAEISRAAAPSPSNSPAAEGVQKAPPIDPLDREIQKQLTQASLEKIAVLYFSPKLSSINSESQSVIAQITTYIKTNPYRLRLVAGGKLAPMRLQEITKLLVKGGVPARLIKTEIAPSPADEDLVEVYIF